MFDTINGIPVHPLVVHGVVVLLPLTILGTLALAIRPAWRRSFGPVVVAVAVVATLLVPVATQSGEKLEGRIGDPGKHAELGDQLIWFVLPLLVLLVAMVVMAHRSDAEAGSGATSAASVVNVVAALSVVAALAAGYQVYRVGDSGARAAWCGQGNPAYDCTRAQ
jgi:hypothetical protein